MLMRASLMLMMLAWGWVRAENVVNTVFFACCAKNCSKTPRYVAAVYARSANRAHVAWVGAAPCKDGSRKPWKSGGRKKGIQKRV